MLQNENNGNVNKSYAVGGGNSLPCLLLFVTVSHSHLTSLDTLELGPGTILGPSGSSGSASTGPTNAYPSTPASSSSSHSTGSKFPGLSLEFSDAYTYRWTQFKHGGHRWWRRRWYSSNFHCHCRAALLSATATSTSSVRSVRKRRAPRWTQPTYGSSSSDGQGTVPSSLPEMTTSLLMVCVCIFVAPAPLMCAHVFCHNAQNAGDPTTYPTYQGTSPPLTYNPILLPSSSSSRNLSAVATAPNFQGQRLGYNGLLIV
jgi:hypothetical protein